MTDRTSGPRTVLVTGAGGFLGGYISSEFRRQNWRVVGVDLVPQASVGHFTGDAYHQLNVCDRELGKLLTMEQPAACVHCAGSASVPLSMTEPMQDFRANALMTAELLDAIRVFSPECAFVLLSSAAVYGAPSSLPIDERFEEQPVSAYGFNKCIAEHICLEYSRLYGIPTACARIFSAYGPGLRRQVLWDLCSKLLGEGEVVLQGTGNESRDFVHARDIARAVIAIVERGVFQAETYNVASGTETSISDLAEMIATAMKVSRRIVFDGILPAGIPSRWRADIDRVRGLGFSPEIAMANGAQEYVAWAMGQLARP